MRLKVFALTIGILISPALNAEVSPWKTAQDAIVAVFGELRQTFDKIIVTPEARDQAIRDLSRLSNRLRDVAVEKQQLTHDLITATTPAQLQAASFQANQLQQAVMDLRRTLGNFFRSMPSSWQSRGGALERTLEDTFGGKWEKLQGIKDRTPNDLVRESKQVEDMLKHAREAVDALIVDLSGRNDDAEGR